MFEDQRGFEVTRFRPGGEGVDREVAQVVGIAHPDVHEEVVLASHVVRRDDLGQRLNVEAESLELIARVLPQADRDDRLEAEAESARVDVGVEAAQPTFARSSAPSPLKSPVASAAAK